MRKFWNKHLLKVNPYVPGEQPRDKKYIKLNTNECPYPPAPGVIQKISNYNKADLRLYPDPECNDLRLKLASTYKVGRENVFIGNGSDEILAFAFMAYFNPSDKVFYPNITYSFYTVYANLFGLTEQLIPLDPSFRIIPEQYYNLEGGIIIANPNAPTGILLDVSEIEKIVQNNPERIVIVDEAYIDFGGTSSVFLTKKYDNLLVIHTYSKSRALAGMRLGYAIGNPNLIQALECVKFSFNSYTINRLSLEAGVAALEDVNYFESCCSKIIATRERLCKELVKFGFEVLTSHANFVFAKHPNYSGEYIYQYLKDKGVLVRHFNKELIKDYLRITVGTEEETDIFLQKINSLV